METHRFKRCVFLDIWERGRYNTILVIYREKTRK